MKHIVFSFLIWLSIFNHYSQDKAMKTVTQNNTTSRIIEGELATVFEIITQHEEIGKWTREVKKSTLIREGNPNRNGVGAIREIKLRAFFMPIIKEEVLSFSPNESYTYTIINKTPGLIHHFGSWNITPIDDKKVKVTWSVNIEYKKHHWFSLPAKSFKKSQEKALKKLQKEVDKHANAN